MTLHANDRRRLPPGATVGAWRAPDGWTCRRLDWRQPAAARGSLLFAGGRGDFLEKYLEAYAHWHGGGWNVTAFDWRGQGGSQGGIAGGHLDSLDPLVDDLDSLIAAWRHELPGPHVAVGHSMGGHVLLRTLAERRPALAAAVLVAPMLMINSAPLPSWAAAWTAGLFSLFGWSRVPAWRQSQRSSAGAGGSLRQQILTSCPERYADELWWWERHPRYSLGVPSWGWLDAAYASCATLTPERLAAVDVPVLLLGTERDRLVSPAAIRRAKAALPRAELVMFPNAGHEILREADPARIEALARIDAFLGRWAGR
jgi:lysophospholipase